MNEELAAVKPYPFERLRTLLTGSRPPDGLPPVNFSVGEPKHETPAFIREALQAGLAGMGHYPATAGLPSLRLACARWLEGRFGLQPGSVDADSQVVSANGTREALFSVAQCVLNRGDPPPLAVMPNPFYQIYEGATLLAGGVPHYLPADPSTGFMPDYESLPEDLLRRTQLLYLCSPSNPTGAVMDLPGLIRLVRLANTYGFVIAGDECYSEIWYDQAPDSLLRAAVEAGYPGFDNCLVFHSLSKRSNIPGARSGFIAGDRRIMDRFRLLRTYTGCATPPFIQEAAVAAWQDEAHVEDNRLLYRQKMAMAEEILSPVMTVRRPEASFYLWLEVPGGGEAFARALHERYNVTVLPGGYLGRTGGDGHNPGDPYVRVALVATIEETRTGLERIARLAEELAPSLPARPGHSNLKEKMA